VRDTDTETGLTVLDHTDKPDKFELWLIGKIQELEEERSKPYDNDVMTSYKKLVERHIGLLKYILLVHRKIRQGVNGELGV